MAIDEKTLKRMIRAMNSVLNLYDEDGIPEKLIDTMMEGVVAVADFLGLTKIALYDKDTGVMIKYIMPVNFDDWLASQGAQKNAK
jgi:hypothetical protein